MTIIVLLVTCFLSPPRAVADELRLKPQFFVTGELYLSAQGTPMILSASKQLILRLPSGQDLWIQDIRRLQGHVKINSPNQALSFVRLWGSPLLAGAIGPSWAYEIASKSEIDGLSFGDARCRSVLEKSFTRMYAIVTKKTMHSEGVRPASVKALKGGFEVTRYVLTVNLNEQRYRIVLVREYVKRDGEYFAKVVSSRSASGLWVQGAPL